MDSGSEKRTEEVEKAFLQSGETESGSYSTFEKVSFGGGERTGNSEKDESAAASISFLYYIQRFCQVKWISIHSEDILVTESRKVRRRLRWRLRQMPRALTRTQVDELYGMLRPLEHPGKYVKRQHERYAAHGKEGRNFPGTFTKNT